MRSITSITAIILLILTVPLFSGCRYDNTLDKPAPKEESDFAKNFLEQLRKNNVPQIKEHLSSDLLTPEVDSKLTELARFFPKGEPVATKLIGSKVLTSAGKWEAGLSYQYQFEQGWVLADILVSREDGKIIVKGIHVNRLPQSLEEINGFTLSGKTVTHYLFLLSSLLIPVFIIYSLILCIRMPIGKRKWIWSIFIIFGIIGFSINWTTGKVSAKLIHFQLLGAGASAAGPYAPWILTISVPLGAIIFLLARNSLAKRETTVKSEP